MILINRNHLNSLKLNKSVYQLIKCIYNVVAFLCNFVSYSIKLSITLAIRKDLTKLFIDISEVTRVDKLTGIHRVVNNLTRELYSLENALAIRYLHTFHRHIWATQWMINNLDLNRKDKLLIHITVPIFKRSTSVIFVDSVWNDVKILRKIFYRIKKSGTKIIGVVYDLIPILHKEYCEPNMVKNFPDYLKLLFLHTYKILCISETVKDELEKYKNYLELNTSISIGSWNLGYNKTDKDFEIEAISESEKNIFLKPTYLMVGTVDRRKGYDIVLKSFEDKDLNNLGVNLCIIGKPGWKSKKLMMEIESKKGNVYYLGQVSDSLLSYAYKYSRCLIQASNAEGYGLPIIEAAAIGTNLLVSDLDVFREVTQGKAIFFNTGSSEDLTGKILRIENGELYFPNSKSLIVRSWSDSAKEFLNKCFNGIEL